MPAAGSEHGQAKETDAEDKMREVPDDTVDSDHDDDTFEQDMAPMQTSRFYTDAANDMTEEIAAAQPDSSVAFTDTANRTIMFLLSQAGTVSFHVNGRVKISTVKRIHAVDRTLIVDGKLMFAWASKVTIPQGQETYVVRVLELFSRRQHSASNPKSETPLNISLISARGLRIGDPWGSSDPYCICELHGKPKSKFKTRTIKVNLNPVWNHMEEILEYQPGDVLTFTVWDKDWIKSDDFLGKVSLPLGDVALPSFEDDLQLLDAGKDIDAYIRVRVTAGTRHDRLRQKVRDQLEAACEARSKHALQKAILAANAARLEKGDISRATELLGELLATERAVAQEAREAATKAQEAATKARKLLQEACLSNDYLALREAIAAAEAANLDASECKMAKELLHLKVVKKQLQEKARELVAKLDTTSSRECLEEAIEAAKAAQLPNEQALAERLLHRLSVKEALETTVNETAKAMDSNVLETLRDATGKLQETIDTARCNGLSEDELFDAETMRKSLHNMVEELKGSLRVFCRVRPLSEREKIAGETDITNQLDLTTVQVEQDRFDVHGSKQPLLHNFRFDAVFRPGTQAEVFHDVKELVQNVLEGYNVTIFAYGQTGSGKTHTMVGTEDDGGISQRTVDELYKAMKRNEKEWDYTLTASVLELYCNKPIDLLAKGTQSGSTSPARKNKWGYNPTGTVNPAAELKSVNIRYDENRGLFFLEDVTEKRCDTADDLYELMELGLEQRVVAETALNTDSSRSHLIIIIRICSEHKQTKKRFQGKIILCDMAGSERLKKSKSSGGREKEAIEINKSLTALGDVVEAISKKLPIVPYRNHKLTQILQDSLGGSAKTLVFVNCSPARSNCEETLTSLRYATRMKNIINLSTPLVTTDGSSENVSNCAENTGYPSQTKLPAATKLLS